MEDVNVHVYDEKTNREMHYSIIFSELCLEITLAPLEFT